MVPCAFGEKGAEYGRNSEERGRVMRSKPIFFLKKIWTAAPLATGVLVIALLASGFFGVRTVVHWIKRPPLSERALPVAAWMTPRYIARSWGVPPKVIARAIDAPIPPPDGPMSLTELAKMRGVSVEQVIAEAEAEIAAFFAERGQPVPEPPEDGE